MKAVLLIITFLTSIIVHCSYLYPNGNPKDIDLSTVIEVPPADRVKVCFSRNLVSVAFCHVYKIYFQIRAFR